MLTTRSWRSRWLLGIGVATAAGCGIFASDDAPPVKIQVIASGDRSGFMPDSTTVDAARGTVVLESTAGYSQAGYSIDAVASDKAGVMAVDVDTNRDDGIFILEPRYVRYRLTIAHLSAGQRRLRLTWRNVYAPEGFQVRHLLDTTVTVP